MQKTWTAFNQAAGDTENFGPDPVMLEYARRWACDLIIDPPIGTPFSLMNREARMLLESEAKGDKYKYEYHRLLHRYEKDRAKLDEMARCANYDKD